MSIIIAGSNPHSLGRYIGKELHKTRKDIWIYGRHAKYVEKPNWHERSCDIKKSEDMTKLFNEINNIEAILFSADSNVVGELEKIKPQKINTGVQTKIIGSYNLIKQALKRKQNKKIKCIWLAGSPSKKPANLTVYGPINAALLQLVNELNTHQKEKILAYYVSTPIISPSTMGDYFIKHNKTDLSKYIESPNKTINIIQKIIQKNIPSGLITNKNIKYLT